MKKHLPLVVQQFSLRYHATLIFLVTSFSALFISQYLHGKGLLMPLVRYPAVSLCAMVVFAFLLQIWNMVFLSKLSPQELLLLQRLVKKDDFQPQFFTEKVSLQKEKDSRWDWSDLDVVNLLDDSGVGLVILSLVTLFFGFVTMGTILEIPVLMGELLLQSLLGAGMIRTVYVFDQTSWSWNLWMRFLKTFFGFVVFSFLVGLLMYWFCPSATRFLELFGTKCWTS